MDRSVYSQVLTTLVLFSLAYSTRGDPRAIFFMSRWRFTKFSLIVPDLVQYKSGTWVLYVSHINQTQGEKSEITGAMQSWCCGTCKLAKDKSFWGDPTKGSTLADSIYSTTTMVPFKQLDSKSFSSQCRRLFNWTPIHQHTSGAPTPTDPDRLTHTRQLTLWKVLHSIS